MRPSFLSNRYYHDFRFGQEDFLSFLSRIEIDPSLRQSVFEYYVGPLNETSTLDNMELIKQILKMDADRELILQLINLSASFESVLQTLFSFLKKTYLLVEDLHVQNKAHVQKLLKIYDTDNFLMNLHMLGAFEYEHESKKDRDSISLLNAAIILQKGTYETGYKFVFGGKCSAQLDKSMIDFQISSRELCEALGNPIKYDILMYLKDTGGDSHSINRCAHIVAPDGEPPPLMAVSQLVHLCFQKEGARGLLSNQPPFFHVCQKSPI